MWLLPQGLVNDSSAPAHEDHVVWAVYVALALASGRDGRGCHHTLRATARLVPDMLLLRMLRYVRDCDVTLQLREVAQTGKVGPVCSALGPTFNVGPTFTSDFGGILV